MILVVGATGHLGGTITRMLLAQGRPVRILARAQSNYAPLAEAGAQVMAGDLKEPYSLRAICEGVDTVITTANAIARGGEDTVQTVDLQGNRNLIDAAKVAGVQQFIFVSALNADSASPIPFIQAKAKTEDYLRDSGLPYTIIVPNGYMEIMLGLIIGMPALQGHPVTIVGEGLRKHSFISMVDVASFIVTAIGHPTALNQKLILGGPEPISLRDAVSVYEKVLGRPIQVKSVEPGQPIPGNPEAVTGLIASLDQYDSPIEMSSTARTFGIQLTSLEEVLQRSLRQNPTPAA